MLVWLLIAVALALLGVLELVMGFTLPFTGMRTILLFLLVLGMGYRIYLMEQGGEKEQLKKKIRALEDKIEGGGAPAEAEASGT
jgi:hypothetical protein